MSEPGRQPLVTGTSVPDASGQGAAHASVAERLARVAEAAASTLGVPIAVIATGRQDRQRVLAHVGLAPANGDGTGEIVVVGNDGEGSVAVTDPDDARPMALTSLVGDARIRAYAHCALAYRGERIGYLIVADNRPHRFDQSDLDTLRNLADWATAEVKAVGERQPLAHVDTRRRRTDVIVASAAEGIAELDHEGRVQYINPAGCEILGWDRDDVMGRIFHDTVHYQRPNGDAYPARACPVFAVMASGEGRSHITEAFTRRDGSMIPVDWSVGPIEEGDEVKGVVMVFVDASARVADLRTQAQFMATVSHELRTPLTSLLGALRIIDAGAAGPVSDDVANLLSIATRNGERLAQLINDVLDTQRASTGTLQLTREPLDVDALMLAAVESVAGLSLEAGVTVTVTPVGATIWGDRHRIVQILTNLLGNAIRFSPSKEDVVISARDAFDYVLISVADHGQGIPREALSRVFEPFWQVDASDARARSGSGMGLAIAQGLAEQHGGSIDVESRVGSGTTFSLRLPRRARDLAVPFDKRSTGAER